MTRCDAALLMMLADGVGYLEAPDVAKFYRALEDAWDELERLRRTHGCVEVLRGDKLLIEEESDIDW